MSLSDERSLEPQNGDTATVMNRHDASYQVRSSLLHHFKTLKINIHHAIMQ